MYCKNIILPLKAKKNWPLVQEFLPLDMFICTVK